MKKKSRKTFLLLRLHSETIYDELPLKRISLTFLWTKSDSGNQKKNQLTSCEKSTTIELVIL